MSSSLLRRRPFGLAKQSSSVMSSENVFIEGVGEGWVKWNRFTREIQWREWGLWLKGQDWHYATNRCDTSPWQVAATNCLVWHVKIIVAETEFCRCDLSHKFKLVVTSCDVSQRQNKRKQPCRSKVGMAGQIFSIIRREEGGGGGQETATLLNLCFRNI